MFQTTPLLTTFSLINGSLLPVVRPPLVVRSWFDDHSGGPTPNNSGLVPYDSGPEIDGSTATVW